MHASMIDPTPDEIARAKRWAAMQTPPVTVDRLGITHGYPDHDGLWGVLCDDGESIINTLLPTRTSPLWWKSEFAAWSALALALRPVFDSIGPMVREECARLAQQHFIPGHSVAGPHFAQQLADAIRAMK